MMLPAWSKWTAGEKTAAHGGAKAPVGILLLSAVFALSACYPAPYHASPTPVPPAASAPKPPETQVYFYPKAGQTNEQQSRDHYDCYNWAIKQTGFDPGQSAIPKDHRVRVVPMPPPGHDTATLAIAGAVLGALIGGLESCRAGRPDRRSRRGYRRRRIRCGEDGSSPAAGGGLRRTGSGP